MSGSLSGLGVQIDAAYRRTVGRAADGSAVQYWEGMINSGQRNLGDVGAYLATTSEAQSGAAAIQQQYASVLGRWAGGGEVGDREADLSYGATLGDVRWGLAHSGEAVAGYEAVFQTTLGHGGTAGDDAWWANAVSGGMSLADMRRAWAYSGEAAGGISYIISAEAGRAASADDISYWQARLSADISLSGIRTAFAYSAEAAAQIQTLYSTELWRGASASELGQRQAELNAGATLGDLRTALAYTGEAANDINSLYQAVLGRNAEAGAVPGLQGYLASGFSLNDIRHNLAYSSEAAGDIDAIFRGVIGQGATAGDVAWWGNRLATDLSLAQVRTAWAYSPQAAQQVQSLYTIVLGRAASATELGQREADLNAGANLGNLRTALSQTGEALGDIQGLYQTVLGRTGNAADVGWWAGHLGTDVSLTQMRVSFAYSAEAAADINAIFTTELGHGATAGDVAWWAGHLATDTSLSGMRTAWAYSGEASGLIQDAYQRGLGRAISAGELAANQGFLNAGGSIATIRSNVFNSAEAANAIQGLYQTVLGRAAIASEVADRQRDLAGGAVLGDLRTALATSAEAGNDIAWRFTNELGRTAGAGDIAFWEGQLARGTSLAAIQTAFAYSGDATTQIQGMYRAEVWRDATGSELRQRQDELAAGATLGNLRTALAHSESATYDITAIYQAVLGRAATAREVADRQTDLANGASLNDLRIAIAKSAEAAGDIQAIFKAMLGRLADATELAAYQGVLGSGWTLAMVGPAVVTAAVNQFYQRVFGRNANDAELSGFRTALGNGMTFDQATAFFGSMFINSDTERSLLRATYKQVTGQDSDDGTINGAVADLNNGAWFVDERYDFAHSSAAAQAVDNTFRDVLGRSASDTEIAIWQDNLSNTGTVGSMRDDLAYHHAGDAIQRIYRQVLDRDASAGELAYREGQLAASFNLGAIRADTAHMDEVTARLRGAMLDDLMSPEDRVNRPDAAAWAVATVEQSGSTLAEIEAGLAAGATLDDVLAGMPAATAQVYQYDTQGNITGSLPTLDGGRLAATSVWQALLGRGPSYDETVGLEAALNAGLPPDATLTMFDQAGKVLGQARADMLLTQLPIFVTLNNGATPQVYLPLGLVLSDGAQVAAFLLGMEARAGRVDARTAAIYNDVAGWLDKVGQQLLNVASLMARQAAGETNADKKAIENEIVKLAIHLASLPPELRAAVNERLNLHGHQADLSLFVDGITGHWDYKVHDIDNTNLFQIIVQAVVLIATAVVTIATWGATAPLLALEASAITALQVVTVVGNLILAGQNFANGDVLGGLLSVAAAAGAALVPGTAVGANGAPVPVALVDGYAQTGRLILAARGVIGGIAASVQAAESGNALGLASGILSVAASAASGAAAVQGATASGALKDVTLFLAGVSTATGIADAYNRGDIQGGLMASLNGVLTAYSIADQIAQGAGGGANGNGAAAPTPRPQAVSFGDSTLTETGGQFASTLPTVSPYAIFGVGAGSGGILGDALTALLRVVAYGGSAAAIAYVFVASPTGDPQSYTLPDGTSVSSSRDTTTVLIRFSGADGPATQGSDGVYRLADGTRIGVVLQKGVDGNIYYGSQVVGTLTDRSVNIYPDFLTNVHAGNIVYNEGNIPTAENSRPQIKDTEIPQAVVPGHIDENGQPLTDAERQTKEYLESKGVSGEWVPRDSEGRRTPDILLPDGSTIEIKTLKPGATAGSIKNAISGSIRRGGQSPNIVVDVRGTGLSEDQATTGIFRGVDISRGKLDSIRVIGDGFDKSVDGLR